MSRFFFSNVTWRGFPPYVALCIFLRDVPPSRLLFGPLLIVLEVLTYILDIINYCVHLMNLCTYHVLHVFAPYLHACNFTTTWHTYDILSLLLTLTN